MVVASRAISTNLAAVESRCAALDGLVVDTEADVHKVDSDAEYHAESVRGSARREIDRFAASSKQAVMHALAVVDGLREVVGLSAAQVTELDDSLARSGAAMGGHVGRLGAASGTGVFARA